MSLVPIALIGDKLGIPEHLIEPCGRYSAKVRLELLDEVPVTRGKLILVTAITPTVTDATLSAGAGFVVAIAGNVMLMPGMGQSPQAYKLDVDDTGAIVGIAY